MTDEELKELIALNERVTKLCNVLKVINQFQREYNHRHEKDIDNMLQWGDDLGDWLEGNLNAVEYKYKDILQMRNELTYLHNEINEVKKVLGMDGSVPTIKPKRKGSYD